MSCQRGLLLLLAVVASMIALGMAGGADRWSVGLAVSPFGWLSLAGVHLLATVPLALVAATWIYERAASMAFAKSAARWRLVWLFAVLAISALTVTAAPATDEWLGSGANEGTTRFIVRCLWSLLLVMPWCLLLASLEHEHAHGTRALRTVFIALTVIVATGVPWIFARHLERQQAERASGLLARGKYADAQLPVLGLCDIASAELIDGKSPQAVAGELSERTAVYLANLAIPLNGTAADDERITRAQAHAQFGQLEAARAEVTSLAERHVEACLLVAATWQEEANFAESNRYYSLARKLAADDVPAVVRAMDGLAFNARAEGRYDDAAAYYLAGLAEYPVAAAHFHYQLGQHYQSGGRPWLAAEQYEHAATLDPAQFAQAVDQQLAKLRLTTPACLPMAWRLGGAR